MRTGLTVSKDSTTFTFFPTADATSGLRPEDGRSQRRRRHARELPNPALLQRPPAFASLRPHGRQGSNWTQQVIARVMLFLTSEAAGSVLEFFAFFYCFQNNQYTLKIKASFCYRPDMSIKWQMFNCIWPFNHAFLSKRSWSLHTFNCQDH